MNEFVTTDERDVLTDFEIKYIIARVLNNANDAFEQAKKNGGDDFYRGRLFACYEILDTIKNELIVRGQDLLDFGLNMSLEQFFSLRHL